MTDTWKIGTVETVRAGEIFQGERLSWGESVDHGYFTGEQIKGSS